MRVLAVALAHDRLMRVSMLSSSIIVPEVRRSSMVPYATAPPPMMTAGQPASSSTAARESEHCERFHAELWESW